METLKTAVIGTGQMGQHHARVYSEIQGSELTAIADIDFERAKEMAKKYGARAYKDYEEMLKKERPDAVSVAVPTRLHRKVGENVLNYSNLLIEKPIADKEEDGRALVKKAEESGKKLMVGHIERFNPIIQYFKEWVEKHGGKYLSFNVVRIGLPNPRAGITSGVILDLGIHDIDIIRYLTSQDVLKVDAKAMSFFKETNFEDHAHIWIKMKDASASIVVNWTSPVKIREMYVTLDRAFVKINYLKQSMEISMRNEEPLDDRMIGYPTKQINLKYREPLKIEIEEFLNSIKEDREPLISGKESLHSLKVALEAEKIARGMR